LFLNQYGFAANINAICNGMTFHTHPSAMLVSPYCSFLVDAIQFVGKTALQHLNKLLNSRFWVPLIPTN
jgi:hypothetical protein